MHDLLSLGEFGAALARSSSSPAALDDGGGPNDTTTTGSDTCGIEGGEGDDDGARSLDLRRRSSSNDDRRSQVLRLPLLLRLLNASRPLASVPVVVDGGDAQQQQQQQTEGKVGERDDDEENKQREQKKEGDDKNEEIPGDDNDLVERRERTDDENRKRRLAVVNGAVPHLEDAAASHPEAEPIDAVVSRLAPSAVAAAGGRGGGTPLGRCGSLRRRRRKRLREVRREGEEGGDYDDSWDVSPLEAALRYSSPRKHKRAKEAGGGEEGVPDEELVAEDDDEDDGGEVDDDGDDGGQFADASAPLYDENAKEGEAAEGTKRMLAELSGRRQRRTKKPKDSSSSAPPQASSSSFERTAAAVAAEDSLDAVVTGTLRELVSLVLSSLGGSGSDGGGGGTAVAATAAGGNAPRQLSVKPDSLLAEPSAAAGSLAGGGGMAGLSATVAALMHHAPVLRHRHVAKALCLAAVPQAPDIIEMMAANCPAAAPCLLRGCLDAHRSTTDGANVAGKEEAPSSGNTTSGGTGDGEGDGEGDGSDNRHRAAVVIAVEAAVKSIAALSVREASRTAALLRDTRRLAGLELLLLLDHDPDAAAARIVEDFSSSYSSLSPPSPSTMPSGRAENKARPRDISSEVGDEQEASAVKPSSSSAGGMVRGDLSVAKTAVGGGRRRIVRAHTSRVSSSLPRLSDVVRSDKALAEQARKRLASCIQAMVPGDNDQGTADGGTVVQWGRATLLVRAYALLVHTAGIGAGSSAGSGSKFVEASVTAIRQLAEAMATEAQSAVDGNGGGTRSSFRGDRFRQLALCACLVICSKFPPIADAKEIFMGGVAPQACAACVAKLLAPSISLKSDVFAARIAGFLSSRNAAELRCVVFDSLVNGDAVERYSDPPNDSEEGAYSNVCRWASCKVAATVLAEAFNRGLSPPAVLVDCMALLDAVRRRNHDDVALDNIIKSVLHDPWACRRLFHRTGAILLLKCSVDMLLRRTGPKLPLLLPLQIESLAESVSWQDKGSGGSQDDSNAARHQFILQTLYALLFLDGVKDSPFVVDPRSLPLGEALFFCRAQAVEGSLEPKAIYSVLKAFVSKYCPDVIPGSGLTGLHVVSHCCSQDVRPAMVCTAIRACIFDSGSDDPSGIRAERFFFRCRGLHPSNKVDVAATSGLLSTKHSPPPYFNYPALCRDPLLLFKCHASSWRCRGIRRIALSVLQRLLDANDSITFQVAPTDEAARELLAARDAIVVRSLVVSASVDFAFDGDCKRCSQSIYCPMTVGMIRTILSRRRGLLAVLLKQGLPECAVDWVVEFVPEVLSDASILTTSLTERSAMTAAERLATADAALRIAIVHGQRDETEAQTLAYAALSVFVGSFFLVIGPVGVPVNVLCEDDGKDVTQMCRHSFFRMLQSMQKISSSRTGLRNEANIALSKIASLCKSESAMGGLAGLAAARRKALLKEIWDAVTRACNALGGLQI